jgi:transposase
MRPSHLRLVFIPPYGPELNPIERLWRDRKDDWAWQHCTSVAVQQDYVSQLLQAYDALTVQGLTGDTYVVDAINALGS